MRKYGIDTNQSGRKRLRLGLAWGLGVLIVLSVGGYFGYRFVLSKTELVNNNSTLNSSLKFDSSVTDPERGLIADRVKDKDVSVSVNTNIGTLGNHQLSAFVFVTNAYGVKSDLSTEDISKHKIKIATSIDNLIKNTITNKFNIKDYEVLVGSADKLAEGEIALIPAKDLSTSNKLLSIDGQYYLDNFKKGAIFREAKFTGDGKQVANIKNFNFVDSKDDILKFNQTGVTALARMMQKKLQQNNDPKYFSAKIKDFLRDADVTHTSNEVSFKAGCVIHNSSFCSDLRFLQTLQDSGFNVIELTGNHNNDVGSQFNTETIKKYHELGWQTFGGGVNAEEATKPAVIDKKGSKIALLGYNYADSPSSGAIATVGTAGANSFDFNKIDRDVKAAKEKGYFVIVDVQFFECYSYPNGYTEMPSCDTPIKDQKQTFRKIIESGADMVVGTQAHHPQTYELYKGRPIYYGLGNLYFDQTQWPGTERGIVLSHYFKAGKLIQTKLTPTFYDKDLQVQVSPSDKAEYLLKRLSDARSTANLENPF